MMFADAEDVESNLVGELDFVEQMLHAIHRREGGVPWLGPR